MSRHRLPLIIALALLVAGAIAFFRFLSPHSPRESAASLARVRAELPDAANRWQSAGIGDYSIRVKDYGCDSGSSQLLEIRNDILVAAWSKPDLTSEQSWAQIALANDAQTQSLADLTAENMLERVREIAAEVDPESFYLSVKFDSEYGFVRDYKFEHNLGAVNGCYHFYRFSQFQKLDEP